MPTYSEWCDLFLDFQKNAGRDAQFDRVLEENLYSLGCARYEFGTAFGPMFLITPPWVLQSFEPFKVFLRNWDEIKESLRLLPGSRVLDIGCGAGPHVAFFAKGEYQVTAIDINELATLTCSANIYLNGIGSRNNHNVIFGNFAQADISLLFDVIITNPPLQIMPKPLEMTCMNDTVFSYMTNAWRDDDGLNLLDILFRKIENVLSQKGCIIITSVNADRGYHNEICTKARNYNLSLVKYWSEIIPYSHLNISQRTIESFRSKDQTAFNTRFFGILSDFSDLGISIDRTMICIFCFSRAQK